MAIINALGSCNNIKKYIFQLLLQRFKHSLHPNLAYLTDPKNRSEILHSINQRKTTGDLEKLYDLKRKIESKKYNSRTDLQQQLIKEALLFPNKIHPNVSNLKEPSLRNAVGVQKIFSFQPSEFYTLAEKWDQIRTHHIGLTNSPKCYFLKKDLARMELALINYAFDFLVKIGFTPISVPDIINIDVLEKCGLSKKEIDHQVYKIRKEWGEDLCLAGTSEMTLAALFQSETLPIETLPLKLVAYSRCFRAEDSKGSVSQNLYRVKQFYKVEMFVICSQESSDLLLDQLVELQTELFKGLDLHFQVLDMPPSDYNNSAYRKVDIEAWMPGRGVYGEISSASNCTDYQSRRLNICYLDGSTPKFAHTLNGTACAIPRMLITIGETHQNSDGTITIPENLRPYLDGQETLPLNKDHIEKMYWLKYFLMQH